jgi:predicted  nucleic acid-binding Zn-ribbon protein
MESILDTLQLYRKELNFLLMNLGADNMPSVIGRIEDTEGNISHISQTIDDITLTVANGQGDIAQLQVRADQISAQVANAQGDVASLIIRADSITQTVSNQAGQISQIKQTAASIQSTVSNQAGEISVIKQTAQGIQSQVSNQSGQISTLTQTAQGLQSQVTNNYNRSSQITQTVDGIQSTVSYQGNQLGTAMSEITQLSNSISSKVSYTDYNGREIASLINQEARRITISAEALDLRGVTAIHGDNYSVATFDRYGDFYIEYGGYKIFEVYNDYGNTDLRAAYGSFLKLGDRSRTASAMGNWDFSYATVTGLDSGGSSKNIESYYSGNNCYIDYGGGERLTVRDMNGYRIGFISFD